MFELSVKCVLLLDFIIACELQLYQVLSYCYYLYSHPGDTEWS